MNRIVLADDDWEFRMQIKASYILEARAMRLWAKLNAMLRRLRTAATSRHCHHRYDMPGLEGTTLNEQLGREFSEYMIFVISSMTTD
jgi:FixJ family two-component response regulator